MEINFFKEIQEAKNGRYVFPKTSPQKGDTPTGHEMSEVEKQVCTILEGYRSEVSVKDFALAGIKMSLFFLGSNNPLANVMRDDRDKARLYVNLYETILETLIRERLDIYSGFPVVRSDGQIYMRAWTPGDGYSELVNAQMMYNDRTDINIDGKIRMLGMKKAPDIFSALDEIRGSVKRRGFLKPPYEKEFTDFSIGKMNDEEKLMFTAHRVFYFEAYRYFSEIKAQTSLGAYQRYARARFRYEAFATIMYTMIKLRLKEFDSKITVREGDQICLSFESERKLLEAKAMYEMAGPDPLFN